MRPVIEIVVSPGGEVRVTTRGIQGPACREASRSLEQALGLRTREELTAEYHLAAPVESHAEERLGERG
jgi:hypothetical protein